jgi:hypothetical protein
MNRPGMPVGRHRRPLVAAFCAQAEIPSGPVALAAPTTGPGSPRSPLGYPSHPGSQAQADQTPSPWRDDRTRRKVCVMPEPDQQPPPRSSPGAFLSNWTSYQAPFATKMRMAVANTLVKLRNRQGCCGNHGQPGC